MAISQVQNILACDLPRQNLFTVLTYDFANSICAGWMTCQKHFEAFVPTGRRKDRQ